jgi:hypothetical protein
MRLLALDADAGVRKQITSFPATVATDLSSLRSNNAGPNKDDDDNDEEYTTTHAYFHRTVSSKLKQVGSQKIKLTSKYFTYLRSNAFNLHLFRKGHSKIHSDDDMKHFNAAFQKQLNFNFAATWATRKKNGEDVWSSHLHDIDLNSVPDFLRDTTNRHELSRYVLKDILACTIDTPFILCIREDGDHDEVAGGQQYYLSFAKAVRQDRNRKKLQTESWHIFGKRYIVLIGRLCRSSHYEAITSHSLLRSAFIKSFNNHTGYFGLLFVNADSLLNVPWQDITDTAVFRPCLTDLSKVGWSQLSSKDVKKVRIHAKEHEKCKQDTTAYIMARVANMKSMSTVLSLSIKKTVDVIPLWAQYMEENQPNNYISCRINYL